MINKEKATAPVSSVGADGKQPLSKSNKKSIADLPPKGNLQATERLRKFTFGINRIEFTLGCSDKVSGSDLFSLIYNNSYLIATQMAHMGTIRLSPLVCHMSWMKESVKDAPAPLVASSLTDSFYPAFL